jgi:hypothetical protein
MEQRTWECWKMAHRTVRCATGQCSVHQAVQQMNQPLSGIPVAHSAIIHRTVWCANGATASSHQRSTVQSEQKWTVPHRSQSAEVREHRTVRCSKTTKAPTVDQLRTLTIALAWRAPDSAQRLSGGAPDCSVRPSPVEFNQWLEVVGKL